MAEQVEQQKQQPAQVNIEGGTYEVLKNRLENSSRELRQILNQLNEARKATFGAIETQLIATERITTENNCVPFDMVPIGDKFIFGYNVHLGLKTQIELSDVFSVHGYVDHTFPQLDYDLIHDDQFIVDFQKLYKYYKETQFVKFARFGPNLYMIFKIGKDASDIKAFKWLIEGEKLTYLDNRSEHEFSFPQQHAFKWKRPSRDYHREGKHPHVSIEDIVFVETVGGDLTIKVEDNTNSGHGIHNEPVDNADQTLDDAEIHYSVLGNLVLMKIKPYQEKNFRYFVFNSKLQEVKRIDSIQDSCILLPDDQGIIFSNGYYLQTGDFKQFETGLTGMIYEKTISAPNGEDYLYVFYNRHLGIYLLLPYNIISLKVENPITCHGYAIFGNGELIFFRADEEPKKHHAAKIWQTPFTSPNYQSATTKSDTYLFKVGNKEIVQAMAECNGIISLIDKGENYDNLYLDLQKMATDVIDSHHWLGTEDAFNAIEPLQVIRTTSLSAIDEFEKVIKIRKNTTEQSGKVFQEIDSLIKQIERSSHNELEVYVKNLAELRRLRGETESLKTLRYVDEEKIKHYESLLKEEVNKYAERCVRFLLRDDALASYEKKIQTIESSIAEVKKVVDSKKIEEELQEVSQNLEMLIDVVSNLNIEDATHTTQIIDNISGLFSQINKHRSALKNKQKSLFLVEGKAEFNAQIKLIEQGVANYLDLSDSPKKCDEYMAKLMVQLEELEGKFADYEEFTSRISEKRDEIYNAFETRKVSLVEKQNRRASNLHQSAERILKAMQSRVSRMTEAAEINSYFASDMMVEKLRNTIEELHQIGDSVKADDIQSKVKTLREDAVRQLRDKKELFEEGADIIKLGKYKFSVNTQPLEVTLVPKDSSMFFHITGTNFYEEVRDEEFNSNKKVWDQQLISENNNVYRSEYLAWQIIKTSENKTTSEIEILSIDEIAKQPKKDVLAYVQKFMALRYNEGYVKGVHDNDAVIILESLIKFIQNGDLLRYNSSSRAAGLFWWHFILDDTSRQVWQKRIKSQGMIMDVFPASQEHILLIQKLEESFSVSFKDYEIFNDLDYQEASNYIFYELARHNDFALSMNALELKDAFLTSIEKSKNKKVYEKSLSQDKPELRFQLLEDWLSAFLSGADNNDNQEFLEEAVMLLLLEDTVKYRKISQPLIEEFDGLQGTHPLIAEGGHYRLNLNSFFVRLRRYHNDVVPVFNSFLKAKKELVERFNNEVNFENFKPRVMSSFVRNKLINDVYLPLIGANLAKQIGETGANKRTDLMGMLLLISPPGYGKTTLMEYVANRLGIIFMKINGPAIGHSVTSLDPSEAPNAAAREELNKLNLSFEMGDNVMIYLDDIQHCNPEFLQKFISLCDAQRKIEGIYKGKSKTYDFRGRKVCVVMAGNPYTESGDKFKIPDMLSNRADIYNLGDIIGDSAKAFELSYLENCITSNPVLNKLAGKSIKDIHSIISATEKGSLENTSFEANHSPEELSDYMSIFNKLFVVRDIILKVNKQYILSAGQSEDYRTEPQFKLQGSYRDMNKIAEKLYPIMNEDELMTLIFSHYENEAQTLTTGAEANLLKFRELIEAFENGEAQRWEEIKAIFQKQQRLRGYGGGDQMGALLSQIEDITAGLSGIRDALMKKKG